MPLKAGNFLSIGQFLSSGDWMRSANGLFFLILNGDGNLCVGRGSGPGDPNGPLWSSDVYGPPDSFFLKTQGDGNLMVVRGTPANDLGAFWATNKYGPPDDFFVIIQDDGNLVVYRGTDPANARGVWWASGATDQLTEFDIANITYDVAAARIVSDSPTDLYAEYVKNETPNKQTITISRSDSATETQAWDSRLEYRLRSRLESQFSPRVRSRFQRRFRQTLLGLAQRQPQRHIHTQYPSFSIQILVE